MNPTKASAELGLIPYPRTFVELVSGKIEIVDIPISPLDGQSIQSIRTPIIAIHGNSGDLQCFVRQLDLVNDSRIRANCDRLILVSLPGHGGSDFPNTEDMAHDVYSFNGYANVIFELMNKLSIESANMIGWSLGGQIVYSMMKFNEKRVASAILFGAPAVTDKDLLCGFVPFDECAMMGQLAQFTTDEARIFNRAAGLPDDDEFVNAAKLCDGRSRKYMIDSSTTGGGSNAREIVKTCNTPICIVIGTLDKGVNNEYIKSLTYKNAELHELNGNHAVHYNCAEEFNEIYCKFIAKVNVDKE